MKKTHRSSQPLGLQTRAMHAGDELNPLPSVSPPIVQSATFELGTTERGAELSGSVAPAELYTRWGNPTTKQAEAPRQPRGRGASSPGSAAWFRSSSRAGSRPDAGSSSRSTW